MFEVLVLDIVVSIWGIAVEQDAFEDVLGCLWTAHLAEVLKDKYDLILIDVVFACQ